MVFVANKNDLRVQIAVTGQSAMTRIHTNSFPTPEIVATAITIDIPSVRRTRLSTHRRHAAGVIVSIAKMIFVIWNPMLDSEHPFAILLRMNGIRQRLCLLIVPVVVG